MAEFGERCPTCGGDALAARTDCFEGDVFCLTCDPPEGDEDLYVALTPSAAVILGAELGRRYMVARFDVTGLTEVQCDRLAGEVSAQAEESDDDPGHPDVAVEITYDWRS